MCIATDHRKRGLCLKSRFAAAIGFAARCEDVAMPFRNRRINDRLRRFDKSINQIETCFLPTDSAANKDRQ